MAAPKNAYQIDPKGETKDETGKERTRDIKVKCDGCGWKGHVGQLLGVDDEETLWCPQCRSSGWVYQ